MKKIKVTELEIDGVKIIEPEVYIDNRGFSGEMYSVSDFNEIGINYNFVVDYQAHNLKKSTFRGIHFQVNPHSQTKLVRVLNGSINDYVIDLRKSSPTYKKWVCLTLSAENKKQILIPKGCGHAFVTLEDNTSVLYKFDNYYNADSSRVIRWNDPELSIDWGNEKLIMSEKDENAAYLKENDLNF